MTRAVARWMRWIAAAPWAWVLLCGALTLLCASGLPGLRFSTDFHAYFSDDNPELQAQRALERHFGNRDSMVLAIAAEEGTLFRNDRLAALQALTEAMAELPWASGSSSLSNFYTPRAEGDEIRAEALIPEGPFDEARLAALQQEALSEPRVLHGLLGRSGEVTAVIGYFDLPDVDPNAEVAEVNAAIAALAAEFERAHPGLRTYRIGSLAFNQAMADAAAYDQRHLFPLAFALMIGLLWICLRGLHLVGATVLVVLMATGTALGLAGHLGLHLTTASMAAPLIILTLSISDCVHVLASYTKLRGEGVDTAAAVEGALRVNLLGVSLTTLTTVIGFLSFNTNDSPPFRDLGNLVALGVSAAWVYALVFLPAWLLITSPTGHRLRSLDLSRLADIVIRHQRGLRWGGAVLLLGLVAAIPLNRFGDNYVKFFSPEIDFRQDTEFVGEHLMGVQYLEYAVPAGSEGGVSEPAYQQRLEAFADWLRTQPGVRKVSTLNELSKRIHQVMHEDDPAWYRLPESRELAAQYLLLFELALPSGSDLSHLVNFDRSVTRVTLGLEAMSNEEIRQLDARAQAWMATHWPPEMQATGTGIPVLFARIAQRNFESMLAGNVVTFCAVALVFMLAFASWRTGLISLIPNFAPMLAGFGLWGLTVGEVGMSLAVVVSLTLGIVVDDSIHFLARYSQGRKDLGLSPEAAIRHAYRDVGAALWITTLALTAGFACLALSSFLLTAHLGLLTSVIIVLALAADLIFLPALLLWFDRSPAASPSSAR